MNQIIHRNKFAHKLTFEKPTAKVRTLPKPTFSDYFFYFFSTSFYFKPFIVALSLFILGAFSEVFAQDDFVEDPLENPSIWQKLTEDPTDSTLWATYYGKSWSAMESKEAEKVNSWKQELMLRKLASNDAVVGFVITDDIDEGFFIDEAAFREFETQIETAKQSGEAATVTFADLQGLEAIIMPEWEGMADLKQNIVENFVILEDMYRDIFDERGLEFQAYHDAHPDGQYSQIKWIEELDGKLRKAKEKQLAELKKKYNINN